MNAQEIIERLGMTPLSFEGGYCRESYQSAETLPDGSRAGTAIYYLLTPDTCSRLHRLHADEVYHFYLGDPVELLLLYPDGHGEQVVLGQELERGMQLQFVVPAGVWQGSRLAPGGEWALMGTTMAPGFRRDGFAAGEREALRAAYPRFEEEIMQLT